MGISYYVIEFLAKWGKEKINEILNNRAVYDLFNNLFPVDCGISALNLPPMPIYDSPHTFKTPRCNSDPLPYVIYFPSKNFVGTLKSLSD